MVGPLPKRSDHFDKANIRLIQSRRIWRPDCNDRNTIFAIQHPGMKKLIIALILAGTAISVSAQKLSISQMKAGIESAANPLAYVRTVLKKKYQMDTVIIANITYFSGTVDSLAYHGKVRKVYGPYDKKFLIQVLGKIPNTFHRIGQVFIDTSLFSFRIADSLANSIVTRVKTGTASFEDMAMTYSMGGEARTKGDIGWVAQGALMPEIEKALSKCKKGDLFKIWSKSGVHIIKKTYEDKQDTGFVLMLRVIL
jgi:PPIC-type PPIASE domain